MTFLIAIRATLSSNWWKQRQTSTNKHCAELQESYRRKGGEISLARRLTVEELTKTIDLTSSKLKDTGLKSGWLNGTDLDPLNMCGNLLAWSLSKASNSGSRTSPWILGGFDNLFTMNYLFPPKCKGRSLVLPQLAVPYFVPAHGRPVPF